MIAGLNGLGLGNWVRHAQLIEDAGADAVELNAVLRADRPARRTPRRSRIDTWTSWRPFERR